MAKRFHSIGDYLGWIHRVHTILERDELIAISGLASWMKECITCRYLAGLWETNLIHQLLWTLWTENVRPSTFQAPSKSWASSPGLMVSSLEQAAKSVETLRYARVWAAFEEANFLVVCPTWGNGNMASWLRQETRFSSRICEEHC